LSGGSDLFFLDLSTPDSPRLLQHFVGAAATWTRAPDDSFALVLGAMNELSLNQDIYVLNFQDVSQLTQISQGVAEQPMLIANF